MKQLQEQFVGQQESIRLMELGFKEKTFAKYNTSKNKFEYHSLGGKKANGELMIHEVAAPLVQQVFEWFRDNHKLFHHVYSVDEFRQDVWWECRIYGKTKNRRDIKVAPAETYREAELECIRKLIELVQ